MVFKKKKKEVVDAGVAKSKPDEPEQEKLSPEMEMLIKTFEGEYAKLFVPQDFAYVRPEALQCNLLFAIWVELRHLQDLVKES